MRLRISEVSAASIQQHTTSLYRDTSGHFRVLTSDRDALAHRGVFIDDDVFRRGHRLARRLAGLNNLPLRLNAWLTHPEETNHAALQHTLTMAAGHD